MRLKYGYIILAVIIQIYVQHYFILSLLRCLVYMVFILKIEVKCYKTNIPLRRLQQLPKTIFYIIKMFDISIRKPNYIFAFCKCITLVTKCDLYYLIIQILLSEDICNLREKKLKKKCCFYSDLIIICSNEYLLIKISSLFSFN